MSIRIERIGAESLARYAAIPSAFTVESVFRISVVDRGLGGFKLTEERVSQYLESISLIRLSLESVPYAGPDKDARTLHQSEVVLIRGSSQP